MSDVVQSDRGSPRWRRFALSASVVLNLFLIAMIGGHLWQSRVRVHLDNSSTPLSRVLARAEASLSSEDAAAFGAVMRENEPRYMADAQRLAATRRLLDAQITAEQFDPEATRKALADWRSAWLRFMDDFSDPLVTALSKVSPEGRQKLVNQRKFSRSRSPLH